MTPLGEIIVALQRQANGMTGEQRVGAELIIARLQELTRDARRMERALQAALKEEGLLP